MRTGQREEELKLFSWELEQEQSRHTCSKIITYASCNLQLQKLSKVLFIEPSHIPLLWSGWFWIIAHRSEDISAAVGWQFNKAHCRKSTSPCKQIAAWNKNHLYWYYSQKWADGMRRRWPRFKMAAPLVWCRPRCWFSSRVWVFSHCKGWDKCAQTTPAATGLIILWHTPSDTRHPQ